MHLGMSGSFRVEADGAGRTIAGRYYHAALASSRAHDHVVFHLSSGAARRLQRSAPLRLHGSRRRGRTSRPRSISAAIGIEPLGNALDGAALAALFAGPQGAAEGGPHGPAADRRPRQHLCLRGAVAGAAVARPRRRHARHEDRKAGRDAPAASPRRSATVLEAAIAAGGSSLRDHMPHRRRARLFPAPLRGLRPRGRALPAPGCRGIIRRMVQSGRSTFYCPVCQR